MDTFNPMLTIVPSASKWNKLLEDSLNNRRKRRALVVTDIATNTAQTMVPGDIHLGKDMGNKPTSAASLSRAIEKDFGSQRGFIYAGAGISMAAPASSPSWWLLMSDVPRATFNEAPEGRASISSNQARSG